MGQSERRTAGAFERERVDDKVQIVPKKVRSVLINLMLSDDLIYLVCNK